MPAPDKLKVKIFADSTDLDGKDSGAHSLVIVKMFHGDDSRAGYDIET